jgi:hypothetical protein
MAAVSWYKTACEVFPGTSWSQSKVVMYNKVYERVWESLKTLETNYFPLLGSRRLVGIEPGLVKECVVLHSSSWRGGDTGTKLPESKTRA